MNAHDPRSGPDTDLARLLSEAVDDLEPTDRLGEIRARTSSSTSPRRWWYAGGGLLAAAAVVTAVAVLGGGPADDQAVDPAAPSVARPAVTADMELYWLGATPQGPRLYRELTEVVVAPGENELAAAVRAVVEGSPDDPDYRSAWDGHLVESVEQAADGSVSVLLTRGEETPRSGVLGARQIAHTAWDVLGERVEVSIETSDPSGPSEGVGVGPDGNDLGVLALVSVDVPAEGQQVSGTFTATGRASSFEATVPWEVRDAAGEVVLAGFATAEGWMDRLHPWAAEVDVSGLAPGTYTFVAMTSDPSGGESGGPFTDTRAIVVP